MSTRLGKGGLGFLLGDGALSYAREDILEAYYNAHNWRGLYSAFDVQLIDHPGYNQARGPVAMYPALPAQSRRSTPATP